MTTYRQYKLLTLKYYDGLLSYDSYIGGVRDLHLTKGELQEFETVLTDEAREVEAYSLRRC